MKPINLKNNWRLYTEIGVVVVAYIIVFLLLAFVARGGPLSSDVTSYADLGITGSKDLHVFNRFFHIFLQSIFIKLSSTPLVGIQFFWAFTVSTTALLIYISARSLLRRSTILHGILAVVFFFSTPTIAAFAGNPVIDFTAMLMVSLFLLVYLCSALGSHRRSWLIILLGVLLYLCLKTKETAITGGILLLGLAIDESGKLALSLFGKRILYLLAGILIGILVYAIMSWALLGDFWWGLRPSEWLTFLQGFSQFHEAPRDLMDGNWYESYFFIAAAIVPFIFYLIGGAKIKLGFELKVLWLQPLALVIFLTLTILDAWGFHARFMLPAVPAICMLAPQVLEFDASPDRSRFIKTWVALLGGIALVLILRLQIHSLAVITNVPVPQVFQIVLFPLGLSGILAIFFIYNQMSHWRSILVFIMALFLMVFPIASNMKVMFVSRPNETRAVSLFYPFSAFGKTVRFDPRMSMYISQNVWSLRYKNLAPTGGYVKTIDDVKALFDLYFNVPSKRENFTLKADCPLECILREKYDYALITESEWKDVTADPGESQLLRDRYDVQNDKYRLLVLLIKK